MKMMTERFATLLVAAAAVSMLVTAPTEASAGADERSAAGAAARGDALAPRAFRAAAAKVMPSIVTIETIGGVTRSPEGTRRPGQRRRSTGISKPGEGPSTGVIVSDDGYILTSTYNFVRQPSKIYVTLHDDARYEAKLLGKDDTRKLCMLKIDTSRHLEPATFVERDELRVGQWAISVGVGYGGEEPAVSAGIISAMHRIFGKAVQTDANVSPANYGGPLIDIRGRVIGICVPLSPRNPGVMAGVEWYDSGIGFAVPVHESAVLLDKLKAGEHVQHGMMGVQLEVKGDKLIVKDMPEDAPAAKAGVQKGDRISAINGEAIDDMMHLRQVMGRFVAGETIRVTIERDGEEQDVDVALAAGIEMEQKRRSPRMRPGQKRDDDNEKDGEDGGEDESEPAEPDGENEPEQPDSDGEDEVPVPDDLPDPDGDCEMPG